MKQDSLLDELLNQAFWRGIAMAFGGAIIFGLPMLMTMEMWRLGFYIAPHKLLALILLMTPLLMALSRVVGFRRTHTLMDDLADTFVAYFVGFCAAGLILPLLGIVTGDMPRGEIVGKIALQAVPGSVGALLALGQLGGEEQEGGDSKRGGTYPRELTIMAGGALLLSLNMAPTQEMLVISYKITRGQALLLMLVTLALMQAFARSAARDPKALSHGLAPLALFLRYTEVAYAIALVMSLYMLWTFDRTVGESLDDVLMMTVVLAFPAGVGAGAARLIL